MITIEQLEKKIKESMKYRDTLKLFSKDRDNANKDIIALKKELGVLRI